MDENRVKHQIKYLGLVENVRIRRAGFAYRREFSKFIQRYGILTKETTNRNGRNLTEGEAIKKIMNSVNMDPDQWQMGRTKVFIKAPESLFLLEEVRDRRYNEYALVLQKAFRKFNAVVYYLKLKNEAADILFEKKERRRMSINRKFYADYIGLDAKPALRLLINKRENVEFAQTCIKYDRQFKKQKRDFILTNKAIYLIGREEIKTNNKPSENKQLLKATKLFNKASDLLFKKSNENRQFVEVVKRRLDLDKIEKIVTSPLQDNFIIILPFNDYATIVELEFKTEFLTMYSKRFKEFSPSSPINIQFSSL
jgi:myosin I